MQYKKFQRNMKGRYMLAVTITWGFALMSRVRPESMAFCDSKWRAFHDDMRMCFSHPYNCTEDDQIPCQMTWTMRTNATYGAFIFSLSGKLEANESTGWIALGLSTDRYMGNDDVMMCILERDGNVTLHHRFNEDRSNHPAENVLKNLLKPDLDNSRFEDGIITCEFNRTFRPETNKPYRLLREFDLLEPRTWYLLFGIGQINPKTGSPIKHRQMPYISDTKIDFTEIYPRITITESLTEAQSIREGERNPGNDSSGAIAHALENGFIFLFVTLNQVTVAMFFSR